MNSVSLIGRTTSDIELRYTNNGTAVSRFTLAVDRRGKERETDFIRCIAWRQPAELISEYVQKGDRLGVTGRIQTGSYEDRQGNKRSTFEIVVDSFDFLAAKEKTNTVKKDQNDYIESKNDGVKSDFGQAVSTEDFDEEFSSMFSEKDIPF